MVANVDKMFYVGAVPWHGLGTKLDKVATSAEAIAAAGLGWTVEKYPVFAQTPEGMKQVPRSFAVTRSDNNAPLGIVGDRYTPMQNKDAFSFFDSVVGVKEAMYHTAGSLGDGERIWILAKLPGYIQVAKNDIVDKYLLLANTHNGTSSVEMLFSPVRVVCQNTLNMAIQGAKGDIAKARHTRGIMLKTDNIRESLKIVNYQYDIMEQASKKMVDKQMNQGHLEKYLEKIGLLRNVIEEDEERRTTRSENIFNTMVNLFEHGKGNDMPEVRGTLWAGYNSVVEYVDYIRGNDKKRANSLLFGSGADIKQKAWDTAVAMIK